MRNISQKPLQMAPVAPQELDTKVELIQALIPLGLLHVQEVLEEEVRQLAGKRYARKRESCEYLRWGRQSGSVYLGDQKLPL